MLLIRQGMTGDIEKGIFREKIKSYVTKSFYSLLEGRWTNK